MEEKDRGIAGRRTNEDVLLTVSPPVTVAAGRTRDPVTTDS